MTSQKRLIGGMDLTTIDFSSNITTEVNNNTRIIITYKKAMEFKVGSTQVYQLKEKKLLLLSKIFNIILNECMMDFLTLNVESGKFSYP